MNLQLLQFRTFTDRVAKGLKQLFSEQMRRASKTSGVMTASQLSVESKRPLKGFTRSPSSVQIALMQRMGVTGRPLMDACKRRGISI